MFGFFIFSLLMLKNKQNLQEIEALYGKHNMVARSHSLSPFQLQSLCFVQGLFPIELYDNNQCVLLHLSCKLQISTN